MGSYGVVDEVAAEDNKLRNGGDRCHDRRKAAARLEVATTVAMLTRVGQMTTAHLRQSRTHSSLLRTFIPVHAMVSCRRLVDSLQVRFVDCLLVTDFSL